jgi:protein-S-isoprenylcysteine O-methyltransferase Ste14
MEDARLRLGEWLFKKRDYTPIPLIIIAIVYMVIMKVTPTEQSIAAGAALVVLGEAIRFWGVSYIGPISRTRSRSTGNLQDSGPFSVVRNPLYVGNFFLSLGLVVVANIWWLIPVYIAAFAFQYHYIVRWEEWNLRGKFGAEFEAYCARVPRWFPKLTAYKSGTHDFKKALKSERVTIAAIVSVSLVLAIASQMGYSL